MGKKILSLFIAFTILFTGCSTRTITPISNGNIEIRTFLTDKDENFYMFVGDKYSYIFNDKKSIQELKELISLARTSGDWKLTNKPKIYLEKDFVSKVNMTFVVNAKKEQVSKLQSLGFEVDKNNSNLFYKNIELIGKYGRTDNEIKEKFQNNYLSHPIMFEEIVFLPDNIDYKDEPSALELVGMIIFAPVTIVVGTLVVAGSILLYGFRK